MVIQCPECQSRFKMADEKAKNGVKVRCSRCQHVFPVQVPPVAEEPVAPPSALPIKQEIPAAEAGSPAASVPPPLPSFAADETGDFSFAAPSVPAAGTAEDRGLDGFDLADFSIDTGIDAGTEAAASGADELDLGSFDLGGAAEFATEAGANDISFDEESPATEFSFGAGEEKGSFDFSDQPAAADFAFDTAAADDDFSFDEEPVDFAAELAGRNAGAEETSAAADDAFTFGDISPEAAFAIDPPQPAAENTGSAWSAGDGPNDEFDFSAPAPAPAAGVEEFDFSNLSFGDDSPASPAAPPLSPAVSDVLPPLAAPAPLPMRESPAPLAPPPAHDDELLFVPPPQPKKRSPLALVVVLLLLLGCGAGYFYLQGGIPGLSSLLAGITGEQAPPAAAGQIRLADLNGAFVDNKEAGQLFVIQGRVVNDFPEARSAIAVKGVLFNQAGQALMQQTVFSGNGLDENALRTLPFAKIEEKMNNQFGDSLSNLNVAPGKSLPFTIVFRNLPTGLAEFTAEVTDSKPGSN